MHRRGVSNINYHTVDLSMMFAAFHISLASSTKYDHKEYDSVIYTVVKTLYMEQFKSSF